MSLNSIAAMLKVRMITRNDKGMFIALENIHIDPAFNKRREGLKLQESIRRLANWLICPEAAARGEKKLRDFTQFLPQLEAYAHPDKNGGVIIVEGHRRTLALRLLQAEGYPIQLVPFRPFTGDAVQRKLRIASSNKQEPLDPLESADLYRDLYVNDGLTHEQIAQGAGVTRQQVERLLVLADAPEEVKLQILDGVIAADTAVDLVRTHRENSGEVIRQSLAEAHAQGKSRVTRTTLKAAASAKLASQALPVLPKPLARDLATAANRVAREVPDDVKALIARYRSGESALGDQTVALTIRSLNALLAATGQIQEVQEEHARKAALQEAA